MTKQAKSFAGRHAAQAQACDGIWSSLIRPSWFCVIALLLLCCCPAPSQTLTNAGPVTNSPSAESAAPPSLEEASSKWAFSASVYGYLVSDDQSYAQPTLTADHDWLHLEARYNYEALKTGSTWIGYNFSGGKKLEWEFTPMLGGVFGDLTGVAPGYKGAVRWWKLELSSEGEYFVDPGDSSGNFFYNWSELTLSPVDWLRFGLVTQRTHAYQTDREIQRGLLAGFSVKRLNFTTYVFNPDESKPTVVLALGFSF